MLRIIFILLITSLSLHAIPPSPEILLDIKKDSWPPPFSTVFTEPSGRNLVPGQFFFPSDREKILVIIIEFSDSKLKDFEPENTTYGEEYNMDYFSRLIFGGDYKKLNKIIKYNKKYNSLKRYYKEISYDQCILFGNIIKVKLDKKLSYYSEDSSFEVDNKNSVHYQIIKDAVLKAQESRVNLSDFDYDQDGYLDHVIVIASALNQAKFKQTEKIKNTCIWPKRVLFTGSKSKMTLNKAKKLGWGVVCTIDSSVGIFAHEFFHEIGGVDLYDPDWGGYYFTDDNDFPVSYWGLMGGMGAWNYKHGEEPGDTPAHPLGYHKWKMGWLEPVKISRSKSIEIRSVENNVKNSLYKIDVPDTGGSEYFLIENRNTDLKKVNYDNTINPKIKMDSGLLITHIDESIIFFYEGNYNLINWGSPEYPHYAVNVVDTKPFYNGVYDERKIDAAFSKEDSQIELTPVSSHGSTFSYYKKKDSMISIKKISSSGKIMKAFISVKTPKIHKDLIAINYIPSIIQNDVFFIKYKTGKNIKKCELQIIDISGETVYQKNMKSRQGENKVKIKIPFRLMNGVYFLRLIGYFKDKSKKYSETVKIIIMCK